MCKKILKCYLLNDNNYNFPHDPFDEGIFCTCMCQYLFTAYFRKMLSFEMLFFYQTFGFYYVFQHLLNISKKKKRTFYSMFGSVIAV